MEPRRSTKSLLSSRAVLIGVFSPRNGEKFLASGPLLTISSRSQKMLYSRCNSYSFRFGFLLALTGAFLVLSSARAELIYDNGAPRYDPRTDGYEMTKWIEADDFTFSAAARIESIQFGTIERAGIFSGSVFWRIHSNSPDNTPGSMLYSGLALNVIHTPTGFVSGAEIEYSNSFAIEPIVLPAGTYWLALHNGPLSSADNQRVYWELATSMGSRSSFSDQGPSFSGAWAPNYAPNNGSTELVFRLTGSFVPQIKNLSYTSGVRRITFTTTSGQFYRVEYKNALNESWQILPGYELFAGSGGEMQASDSSGLPSRQRSYRVLMF